MTSAEGLPPRLSRLQNLSVRKDEIAVPRAMPLVTALPLLETLDLSRNGIGDDGAIAVAASLKGLPRLQTVYLCLNNIGDVGAVALAAAMNEVPLLQTLDLSGNKIGDDGAVAVAASLKGLPLLWYLNLFHNNIGVGGATTLALGTAAQGPQLGQQQHHGQRWCNSACCLPRWRAPAAHPRFEWQ